ncbi:MAG: conserved phage C-terminal domain-containing protein [Deltaproteobacteria bacterium]|nr:conserved phage C-terminal domain-containing protein [Deltaproteobacteria bacterium]
MTSPQVENGYLIIANEIAERFCNYRISGEEWLVLWAILRKTYGWQKKEDRISLSQFAAITGLKRQTVLRALRKLASKGIITIIKNDDTQVNTYRFNKHFDEWVPLSKKTTVIKKDNRVESKKITGVIKDDNKLSSFLGHTKDNKNTSTKNTIQKKAVRPPYEEIVNYLNQQAGKSFSPKTRQTRSHINARFDEGFTLADCKVVIDNKCTSWLHDPEMSIYLRPETIFGTKFESYLNETCHPMAGRVSNTTLRNISILDNWSPPA